MDINLRPWREEDLESLVLLADDWEIARWLRDAFPHPYSREDGEAFLRLCLSANEEEAILLALEAEGRAIGSVSLTRGQDVTRLSAELGYWLGRPYWGRGIMTGAVEELCRLGFARWDIRRIWAQVFAPNAASCRVLEKAGFRREGLLRQNVTKAGETMDSWVYGLLREEASGGAGPAGLTTGQRGRIGCL